MPVTNLPVITPDQCRQYQEEGYFILERALSETQLDILREECQGGIENIHAEMDRRGEDTLFISHRNKRYFIPWRSRERERLRSFVFGDVMAEICRATLGENAWVFLDQFVVKAAEIGMQFAWHQDSGYVSFDHRPYLTCWIALDDMTVENGTVYILPYSHLGVRTRVTHIQEPGTNDMVGYFGKDPGIPVIVPAGSIAVFSSTTFHRSGTNTTHDWRRVYLCQYTAQPMIDPHGKPFGEAVPFLKDGAFV